MKYSYLDPKKWVSKRTFFSCYTICAQKSTTKIRTVSDFHSRRICKNLVATCDSKCALYSVLYRVGWYWKFSQFLNFIIGSRPVKQIPKHRFFCPKMWEFLLLKLKFSKNQVSKFGFQFTKFAYQIQKISTSSELIRHAHKS